MTEHKRNHSDVSYVGNPDRNRVYKACGTWETGVENPPHTYFCASGNTEEEATTNLDAYFDWADKYPEAATEYARLLQEEGS